MPTDNPMPEKEVWLSFRDVVHGLEYRKYFDDILSKTRPKVLKSEILKKPLTLEF